MSNTRRSYSRDFKISAVKKVIEHGLPSAEVGRDLGINDGMLRNWKQKKGPGNLPSSEPFVGRSPERRPTTVIEKQDFKLPLLVDSEGAQNTHIVIF